MADPATRGCKSVSDLEVIGAGFGRTGTLSVKVALETLGFGPCHHMTEITDHPAAMEGWCEVVRDRDRLADLLAGYRSTMDWPSCAFWEDLITAHPQAKVILTVRDPDAWYDSMTETIVSAMSLPPARADALRALCCVVEDVILDQVFDGRFDDRGYAIGVFEAHAEQVRDSVPPGRLLEFDVGEGWAPLCRFLDRPQPSLPFPVLNRRAAFAATLQARV
jgi:sulfotransferase family protein